MEEDVAMNEIGWGMTVPSWVGIVSRCSSQPPNGVNSGFYCNEKVDELLKQAVATKDKDLARQIYQQANRIIMDDAAFIPFLDDFQPILTADYVKGFVNPPEDWVDLSTVYIED